MPAIPGAQPTGKVSHVYFGDFPLPCPAFRLPLCQSARHSFILVASPSIRTSPAPIILQTLPAQSYASGRAPRPTI